MAPTRSQGSSREAILEAATRVAGRDGLMAMTLDNVAREAGLSKGGLMYHFASKDSLVSAMIEHFAGTVRRALTERVARDPEPRGRWVRAFVDTVLPEDPGPVPADGGEPNLAFTHMKSFYTSMLAAMVMNPELLAPIRAFGTEVRSRVAAEGDFDQLLSWLAVDGLLLWNMFGLVGPDDPLPGRIAAAIRARTRPPGGGVGGSDPEGGDG